MITLITTSINIDYRSLSQRKPREHLRISRGKTETITSVYPRTFQFQRIYYRDVVEIYISVYFTYTNTLFNKFIRVTLITYL